MTSHSKALDSLAVAGMAVLIASPTLFTHQPFMLDYENSFWLSWVQGHDIASALHPSYFIHTTGDDGVFNPIFAFYGGTVWVVFGAAALLLGGHYGLAFGVVTAAAAAAAYGGTLWLARQCRVKGLLAHVPALVFPTSAYYVTNLYGRGDLAEFMSTSSIPLVIASAVYLLRTSRWTALPVLAFLGSLVILTGSHNITLLWASVVGLLTLVLLAAIVRPRLPSVTRIAAVVGLACLGTAVNAWSLVPDLLYGSRTNIGVSLRATDGYGAPFFNTPQVLFDPFRSVPSQSSTPGLFVQLPVWFLFWACCGAVLIWTQHSDRPLRRVWLILAAVLALLVGLILSESAWNALPALLKYAQFPYRVVTFATLAITGLVLVSCVGLVSRHGRAATALRVSAAGVALVSLGLCVWQLWEPTTEPAAAPAYYASRGQALVSVDTLPPKSWYEHMAYADDKVPVRQVAVGRSVTIDPAMIHDDHFSGTIPFPAGPGPVVTNIAGGSYFVSIKGVRRVGRSPFGFAVVERTAPGVGPVHIVVETARSVPLVLAWWLSAIAILGSLVLLAALSVRSAARWRRDAT
jgi:hypothetical protein